MELENKIWKFTNNLKMYMPASLVGYAAKALAFTYYLYLEKFNNYPTGDVDDAACKLVEALTEEDISYTYKTVKELAEAAKVGPQEVYANQGLGYRFDPLAISLELSNFTKDELLAMLNNSFSNSIHDESTPDSLSDLVLLLANKFLKQKINVTDMTCGEGSFLLKAAKEYTHIEGVEINISNSIIANMRLHANKIEGRVRNINCFEDSWHHQTARVGSSLVFSEFPWKLIVKDSKQREIMFNCNANRFLLNQGDTSDYFFLSAMMNYLERDDSLAISVVPLSILSNLADKRVRDHMIRCGFVKAVITLPTNIFTRTNIGTAMVVLSNTKNERVALFDGSPYFKKENRKINSVNAHELFMEFSKSFDSGECLFTYEEIAKHDYSLSPSIYFKKIEKTIPNATELVELADIFTGWQVPSAKLESIHKTNGTGTCLLQMSNVENGSIVSKLERYAIPENTIEKFKVQKGDVVISTKSLRVKSAVVDFNADEPIVAAGSIMVIRPKDKKLDPYYLVAYFESDLGRQVLEMYQTGNIIPNLSINNVKKIPVPGLLYERQVRIGAEYMDLRDLIRSEKERLKTLESKVNKMLDNLWDTEEGE